MGEESEYEKYKGGEKYFFSDVAAFEGVDYGRKYFIHRLYDFPCLPAGRSTLPPAFSIFFWAPLEVGRSTVRAMLRVPSPSILTLFISLSTMWCFFRSSRVTIALFGNRLSTFVFTASGLLLKGWFLSFPLFRGNLL